MTKQLHPQIGPGCAVQYYDTGAACRTHKVISRRGNVLTVVNALGMKRRLAVEKVRGYWPSAKWCKPENMISIL